MILVDSMMVLHRAKYKLDFLANIEGRKTGMEYGFLKCCEALTRKFNDDNLVLCWEGRNNFRYQIYPKYKANRKKKSNMPDGEENPLAKLDYDRVDEFREFLKHPFANAEAHHYEADDVIASLVDRYKGKEQIVIYSNDKDLLQLVDDGVLVVRSFQEINRSYTWTSETVEEKYDGLLPSEIPIFLAFAGDVADNIPGIPRIRKAILASAIINARDVKAPNLVQSIANYECWSGPEVLRIEEFIAEGFVQRNLELIILRRPDIIVEEATKNEEAIKKWLIMMEFRSLKMCEGMEMEILTNEEF